MENSKVVVLPSGSELRITPAPFSEAKALYQMFLSEMKDVQVHTKDELFSMMKDMACHAFSSKKIEAALAPCLARALYNGKRINDELFEDVGAREDYVPICFEVAQENIRPFLKSLFAQLAPLLGSLESIRA